MTYIALKNYLYLPEQVQKNKADINTLRNAFQLEYSDTTEYFKPQIVSVDGVAYIALRDTPFKGHYPPTSPDFWAVFASGPTGPQGPQGPEGPQGPSGVLGEWQTATMDTELSDGTYLIKFSPIYPENTYSVATVYIEGGKSEKIISTIQQDSNNLVFYINAFVNKKLSPTQNLVHCIGIDEDNPTATTQILFMNTQKTDNYQYIKMK